MVVGGDGLAGVEPLHEPVTLVGFDLGDLEVVRTVSHEELDFVRLAVPVDDVGAGEGLVVADAIALASEDKPVSRDLEEHG